MINLTNWLSVADWFSSLFFTFYSDVTLQSSAILSHCRSLNLLFLAGPQRAKVKQTQKSVTEWVMKLQDWSAECWSFLIGRCSFKMKRQRTVLCLRFLGSLSAVQCYITLCCCCAGLIVYVRLSYVMLCFVLCYVHSHQARSKFSPRFPPFPPSAMEEITTVAPLYHTINGSKVCRNNYIMMLISKKSEFMLCRVCPQDDKQTTFKMLVFSMEFGSISARLC